MSTQATPLPPSFATLPRKVSHEPKKQHVTPEAAFTAPTPRKSHWTPKKQRTMDRVQLHPLWASSMREGEEDLFWRLLAARTGVSIFRCKEVINHNPFPRRFNWIVCREAYRLMDEFEARAAVRKERSRVSDMLREWLLISELSTLLGETERSITGKCLAGVYIARPRIFSGSSIEVLAASALPPPVSAILPPEWIAAARDLAVAHARASIVFSAHMECGRKP